MTRRLTVVPLAAVLLGFGCERSGRSRPAQPDGRANGPAAKESVPGRATDKPAIAEGSDPAAGKARAIEDGPPSANELAARALLEASRPIAEAVARDAEARAEKERMASLQERDSPGVERNVAAIMAMPESKLVALVPDQCPDVKAACPVCKKHMRFMKTDWKWSYSDPEKLVCPKCSTQACPNPEFAPDKTAHFTNLYGQKIARRYYRGAKPRGDLRGNRHGDRYFFGGALDDLKFRFVRRAINDLAKAYRETRKQKYARKALLLLDAFGHKYRYYLCHEGRGTNGYYINTDRRERNAEDNGWVTDERKAPFSWSAGRIIKWWGDEMLRDVIPVYGALRGTKAMADLSEEKGYDVALHIDNHVMREMADFVLLIPWKKHMANNLSGMFVQLAQIGETTKAPEYAHKVYKYCSTVMESYGREHNWAGYSYDLHNSEGAQGHYGVMSRIHKVFKSIEGYSDPDGYAGREDGLHFDNLELDEVMPLFDTSIYAPEVYCLPSGALSPTHDTIGYNPVGVRGANLKIRALEESRCSLLPGFGHAVLGAGKGKRQSQVHMRFSTHVANHTHRDNLGLIWYAHGHELSGDIGYQRNKLRSWSSSTLSHNTVVVDRTNQAGGKPIGNLRFFEDLPGLSAVCVDSTAFYKESAITRYRRTVIHSTVDTARPYFIDVFEVSGGTVHDYAMHGSVLGTQRGESSLRLADDTKLLSGGSDMYKLFRNVRSGVAASDYTITFAERQSDRVGTRIHLFRDPSAKVILGESPALRPVGHYNDKDVFKYWMPHLIVRRSGERSSVFVAVYDMFGDGPAIDRVERLDSDDESVALRVIFKDGRRDTMLLSLSGPAEISCGGVEMNGTLGCVAKSSGRTDLFLVEGTLLAGEGRRLDQKYPGYAGKILSGERIHSGGRTNSVVTDVGLPAGRELEGKWLVLEHGDGATMNAHQIDHIERRDGQSVIHLERDHGMVFENGLAREVLSPWRSFEKPERFIVRCSSTTAPARSKGSAAPVWHKQVPVDAPKLGLCFSEEKDAGAGEEVRRRLMTDRSGVYSGYVLVPTDGAYTFSLEASHEAALTIAGTELVNSRGLGPYRVWKAGIRLRAGFHPLSIWYQAPKRGMRYLTLKYEGPDIEYQLVPDHALFH